MVDSAPNAAECFVVRENHKAVMQPRATMFLMGVFVIRDLSRNTPKSEFLVAELAKSPEMCELPSKSWRLRLQRNV